MTGTFTIPQPAQLMLINLKTRKKEKFALAILQGVLDIGLHTGALKNERTFGTFGNTARDTWSSATPARS